MLITFKTRARYPSITMFGDVALRLLALMGRRDTVPSAIEAEDIPAALKQLRAGLEGQADAPAEGGTAAEDEESKVTLGTRAGPLIEMLEAAAEEDVGVGGTLTPTASRQGIISEPGASCRPRRPIDSER